MTLSHGHMRRRFALILWLAGAFFLVPLSGHAQESLVETMTIGGTSVKLVVPSGYCKLDRKFHHDAMVFDHFEKQQSTTARLLLAFGDCETVRLFRTHGGLREGQVSFGLYWLYVDKEGKPMHAPADTPRAKGLAELYATVPPLDLTALSETAEWLVVGTGQETKRPYGSLAIDENAVYMGLGGRKEMPQGETRYRRMISVFAATILSGMIVECELTEPPVPGSPFAAMLQKQKAWSANLVQAN